MRELRHRQNKSVPYHPPRKGPIQCSRESAALPGVLHSLHFTPRKRMNLLPSTATPSRAIEALTISAQNETRKPCTDEPDSLSIGYGRSSGGFGMRRPSMLLFCVAGIVVEG